MWLKFMYGVYEVHCTGGAVLVVLYLGVVCPAFSQEGQQVDIEDTHGVSGRSEQSEGCICELF